MKICEIIKSYCDDYKIFGSQTSSYELFFVHGKLETVRKSESDIRTVTLYCDHDGKRGNSAFNVYASMSEADIERKARSAHDKAMLIFDEPYSLPSDRKSEATIPSNLNDMDEKKVAARIARAVSEANTRNDCDINALEVFVTSKTVRVVNSQGIDRTQNKHTVSVEAIPTCNGSEQSVELFETYTLAELDEHALTEEIAARLGDVKARLEAVKPQTALNCPVVLNPEEICTLFSELIADRDYAREYGHSNLLNVGDMLQTDPTGDRITITMRARINGSPLSSYFDEDGSELTDVRIVEDGKVVGGYGSFRFAQYLDKAPTGKSQCIEVDAGATSESELLKEPHLELVYLSGLQVDLYNDYIGGEIRLAYYFDGNVRIPVTGIAMSGKLSEALNTARLSKETCVRGGYFGPRKIMLNGINIY